MYRRAKVPTKNDFFKKSSSINCKTLLQYFSFFFSYLHEPLAIFVKNMDVVGLTD